MPDLQHERAALGIADWHIADGERRIDDVADHIRDSEAAGWDTALAKRLLLLMRETLDQCRVHRGLILDAIARCSPQGRVPSR